MPGARAGLIPVRRSADIPSALGWAAAGNHYDTGPLSTDLRSWEDRFGLRVVALHFDRLDVSVRPPPSTMTEALRRRRRAPRVLPGQRPAGVRHHPRVRGGGPAGEADWTFWWD